jgi:hypothetical protein
MEKNEEKKNLSWEMMRKKAYRKFVYLFSQTWKILFYWNFNGKNMKI